MSDSQFHVLNREEMVHVRPPTPQLSVARWCVSVFVLLSLSAGCSPSVHKGRQMADHRINHARVIDDVLSIQGSLPLCAYTDYGVKLLDCKDDTGRDLRLRSAQIFWMKGEFFELELDPPGESATQVSMDLLFTTRSGLQRIAADYEDTAPGSKRANQL
ncbi:MAG: hypothetical protein H6818_08845 [Phycisphaerales bacterium]|nr:hypothetical protein [Phycisphaerales bacterium]MCB9862677.1 hypothetical protein [Phycisphaerales bacterium]